MIFLAFVGACSGKQRSGQFVF